MSVASARLFDNGPARVVMYPSGHRGPLSWRSSNYQDTEGLEHVTGAVSGQDGPVQGIGRDIILVLGGALFAEFFLAMIRAGFMITAMDPVEPRYRARHRR